MKTRTIVLTLALMLLTPVALAATGPFHGSVRQGETRTHHYDNNPSGMPCIQLATTYTVTLRYAPTTDTLTLTAGGQTATGTNGTASVTFSAGVCAAFDIMVTGTDVEDRARYTVTVSSGGATPI